MAEGVEGIPRKEYHTERQALYMLPPFTQDTWTLNNDTITANSNTIAILPSWGLPDHELSANAALIAHAPSLWHMLLTLYHYPHLHTSFPTLSLAIHDLLCNSASIQELDIKYTPNIIPDDLPHNLRLFWNALRFIAGNYNSPYIQPILDDTFTLLDKGGYSLD